MLVGGRRLVTKPVDCDRIGLVRQQIGKRHPPSERKAAKIGRDRSAVEHMAEIDHRDRGADDRRRHAAAPQLREHNLAGTAEYDRRHEDGFPGAQPACQSQDPEHQAERGNAKLQRQFGADACPEFVMAACGGCVHGCCGGFVGSSSPAYHASPPKYRRDHIAQSVNIGLPDRQNCATPSASHQSGAPPSREATASRTVP